MILISSITLLGRTERLKHLLPEAQELRITGFQSPAEDEKEASLSLDRLTGLGAPQIWVMLLNDDSALGFGMYPGDRLIIDRSSRVESDAYLVVDIDGSYFVRLLTRDTHGRLVLKPPHPFGRSVNLETEDGIDIFGVVKWVLSYVGR